MNTAQYFEHWNIMHRDHLPAAAMIEDADLSLQPSKHYSRNIRDIPHHVINQQEGWIHSFVFRELATWLEEDQHQIDNIAAFRERLEKGFAEITRLLKTISMEDLNRVIQVPGNGAPKHNWIL